MMRIADNLHRVNDGIRAAARSAGRDVDEIRLVAISKTVGPERVREAYAAGQRLFGENRAQELLSKTAALGDLAIDWHFVGHLQKNKVRHVVALAALIHSVDSLDLARRIDERAAPGPPQPVLVQVNVSGEESKSGVAPERLTELLDGLVPLANLSVEGLMTIGPLTTDAAAIRTAFRSLRRALEQQRARGRPGAPLRELSMGMSGDFETAIEEGATLVRIGTAIFGERQP